MTRIVKTRSTAVYELGGLGCQIRERVVSYLDNELVHNGLRDRDNSDSSCGGLEIYPINLASTLKECGKKMRVVPTLLPYSFAEEAKRS